jgi:ADP-ribose pyrophosphatase YjhB (NUDIX family)
MSYLSVSAVVQRQAKVLLVKREDYEVWDLPGGGIDAGESAAQAVVRETLEETGLLVEPTRLVGVYSCPRWHNVGDHVLVFAAKEVGGALQPDPGEAVEAGYFDARDLPEKQIWFNRQRILDAVEGKSGMAWTQDAIWPFADVDRLYDTYAKRDASGLGRTEYFERHFSGIGPGGEQMELDGDAAAADSAAKGAGG